MTGPDNARQWRGVARAATAGPADMAREKPGPLQVSEEPFTYDHAPYEAGQHWFSAEHDGDEVGHAYVIERQEPAGPHVEIKELWTNPHYRGQGIGSRLLDNVGEHFKGHDLRLKPYPIDEDGGKDESGLREFYSNRGFGDYQLREGDPFELYDYMTKRAFSGPATKPADARSVYLHGGPNRVEPGDVIHQGAMPESYGRLRHSFFTTSRKVAEDAADMRDGLGHGWIHTVEPTGPFEVDPGEPDSWKSKAPLRVLSVEPGHLNGKTAHPPIMRQPKTAAAGSPAVPGELHHSAPYADGVPGCQIASVSFPIPSPSRSPARATAHIAGTTTGSDPAFPAAPAVTAPGQTIGRAQARATARTPGNSRNRPGHPRRPAPHAAMASEHATAGKDRTMQPDQQAAPGLTAETARRWDAVQPASGNGRICIGDTRERAELVDGLRSLADYLAANPSVPVPYGWRVAVYAQGTDSEQFSQVDLVAEIVGEPAVDRRAATGHHHVQRSFGPVSYEFVAIADWRMAQHRAGMSYADSVVPDRPAEPPARLAAEAFPAPADTAAIAAVPARPASGPATPRARRRGGVTP